MILSFVPLTVPLLLPVSLGVTEDVHFTGGDLTLAGSLRLPDGEGPHPAIVITHGSEPGRRTGYGPLVDLFADAGLAVLTYDKRGVGDSEGVYVEAPDLRQPCVDLLGAVAFLRGHEAIDGERIGVFGGSQGGWVAPMAASMSTHIRFVAVQSAPGVSTLEQNLFDKGNQLRSLGVADADVERATAYRRAYWGYLTSGEGFERARELRAEIEDEPWFTQDSFPYPFVSRERLLRHPRVENFAIHSGYEPRLTLERVKVPLLALYGGDDSIVPVERSVAAFEAAFATSGNEHLTVRVFEGGDHGIRVRREDGSIAFAEGFQDTLRNWVAEQAFDSDR